MKDLYRRLAAVTFGAALVVSLLPAGAQAEEPGPLRPDSGEDPVCSCETLCEEGRMDADCPVCGAEGAVPEACALFSGQPGDTVSAEGEGPALLGVLDGVAYVDESGDAQTQSGVTEVTAEDSVWASGWYVVDDWVDLSDRVTVDGDVCLILADEGYLNARGGIQVGDGNSLTIYAQEAGTGTVIANSSAIVDAAIGGNEHENGGTICIHGGIVRARNDKFGYDEAVGAAAGIGGGANGDGGYITITGGTVEATGARSGMEYETMSVGASIGGGSNGGSGRIIITGGRVSADSVAGTADAIGCGSAGTGGSVSITGGYFSRGDLLKNTVCGIAVAEGLSVILQTVDNQTWYWVTDRVEELSLFGGTEGVDYAWSDGVVTILTGTPMTVSGSGWICKERIVVASGVAADLTIENVNIYTESAPIEISAGSTLELTLMGENQLSSASGAGILNQGTLTISGSGTVELQGGSSRAGIETTVGVLIINGGDISATGGYNGAGIGGGRNGSGGTITINGGTVTASGQERAAGIGGGYGAGGGSVAINGGIVVARGGYWGAGIGGGGALFENSGDGGTIQISGGEVTAVGGSNSGAGIGGGGGAGSGSYAGSGEMIEITGGTVNATSRTGAGIGGGGHTNESVTGDMCGSGGSITISGGTVTAFSQYGAGIGGGTTEYSEVAGGAGGEIEISGGTVTAVSDREDVGIGGGAPGAASGTFSTGENGNAVITATAISDQSGKAFWSGIFFEGIADGKIYGTEITPSEDFTIPADSGLIIGESQLVTIPNGVTVTIEGSVTGDMTLESGAGVQIGNGPTVQVGAGGGMASSGQAIVLPDGGSVSMTDGQEHVTTVTMPAGGGSIAPDGSGSVIIPSGSTVQTGNGPEITVSGEGTAVTPAGELTLPGGSSVSVSDGQGSTITVTMPAAGGSVTPDGNGGVTIPAGSVVQTGSGQSVTIPESGGVLRPDGEICYAVRVTFDSQGGSAVSTQEIMVGSLLTQPEQPVRDGYTFTGWYQDAACTVAWNFADMPVTADITLYAGWKKTISGGSSGGAGSSSGNSTSETEPSGEQGPQSNPFTDVPADAYYADAVLWAVENDITAGLTETVFGPDQSCTRAQMVTFLWRAAGSPAPASTDNPFTDVAQSAYYYDAVLWAAEQGITGGTGAGTFSPGATVTRAQTVTFLYRAAGSPAASGSGFADVAADAYYSDAVAWAADQGITSGTTPETFSPAQACTRAQIVTFLYRDRA